MSKTTGKKRSLFKRILRFFFISGVLLIGVLILSEYLVETAAKGKLFNNVSEIPKNKVGLLLGTSKYSTNGQNLFFNNRIDATVKLFKAGRIEYVLVSGDNGTVSYNEPEAMKKDLIARGIPKDRIVSDFAGFRTLDSVVRSKEVFGQTSITIISQQFHNERALYIAKSKGIDAVALNAGNVGGDSGLKVKIRERFARLKMLFDLLINTQPKFLGPKIQIG